MFLLKSAYSYLKEKMDAGKPNYTNQLTDYYDFAKNTHGGKIYADDEFYKDRTYTRTLANRVVDAYYKLKELSRDQFVLKQVTTE